MSQQPQAKQVILPMFADSHCHIHDSEFELKAHVAYEEAMSSDVELIICVGTSVKSSLEAVTFCQTKKACYYSLALHPHEAANLEFDQLRSAWLRLEELALENKSDPKFVAIGECGLDYFYHKDQNILEKQGWLLSRHLELAQKLKKPVIFHVRDAFDDFWPIYDKFELPGVVHSFSSVITDMESIINRGSLYVGLNGIMTFTKDQKQLYAATMIPLNRLMLETDSPYLTPNPIRGTINTPANVRLVAEFLSDLRKEPLGLLADQTTTNTKRLFGL